MTGHRHRARPDEGDVAELRRQQVRPDHQLGVGQVRRRPAARPATREHQCRLENIPGVVGLAAQAVDLGFGRRSSF